MESLEGAPPRHLEDQLAEYRASKHQMEMRHGKLVETLHAMCGLDPQHAGPLSLEITAGILASDPEALHFAKNYLNGEWKKINGDFADENIKARLAWAVIDNLERKLNQTYSWLGRKRSPWQE